MATTHSPERRIGRRPAGVVAALVIAVALAAACGSPGPAKPSDPTLAQGYDLHQANCAVCHGASGGGGAGPALVDVGRRLTDAQITDAIANGRKDTAMPAWKERGLSDADIAALTAYVKTLDGQR
jgi:mono/diheme cytochrome c family protein